MLKENQFQNWSNIYKKTITKNAYPFDKHFYFINGYFLYKCVP